MPMHMKYLLLTIISKIVSFSTTNWLYSMKIQFKTKANLYNFFEFINLTMVVIIGD